MKEKDQAQACMHRIIDVLVLSVCNCFVFGLFVFFSRFFLTLFSAVELQVDHIKAVKLCSISPLH